MNHSVVLNSSTFLLFTFVIFVPFRG